MTTIKNTQTNTSSSIDDEVNYLGETLASTTMDATRKPMDVDAKKTAPPTNTSDNPAEASANPSEASANPAEASADPISREELLNMLDIVKKQNQSLNERLTKMEEPHESASDDSGSDEYDTDQDEADAKREAEEFIKEKTMLCRKCQYQTVSRNSTRGLCHSCERILKNAEYRKILAKQKKNQIKHIENVNTRVQLQYKAELREETRRLKRERREIKESFKSRSKSSHKRQKK